VGSPLDIIAIQVENAPSLWKSVMTMLTGKERNGLGPMIGHRMAKVVSHLGAKLPTTRTQTQTSWPSDGKVCASVIQIQLLMISSQSHCLRKMVDVGHIMEADATRNHTLIVTSVQDTATHMCLTEMLNPATIMILRLKAAPWLTALTSRFIMKASPAGPMMQRATASRQHPATSTRT